MCIIGILNKTCNLTTYWKAPLKMTLFNPLPIQTQYTFPIKKQPHSLDIANIHFFIKIFYAYQYENLSPPIYPPIFYFILSSIHIPQYECTWYDISPTMKPHAFYIVSIMLSLYACPFDNMPLRIKP